MMLHAERLALGPTGFRIPFHFADPNSERMSVTHRSEGRSSSVHVARCPTEANVAKLISRHSETTGLFITVFAI